MDTLESELKKAMGYTEEVKNCEKCVYSEEEECRYTDRMWYTVCKYNTIMNIIVTKTASCNKFELKK